jgi:hypothetical protein
MDGPCTPSWMATWAAPEFGMILVTENGLTLAGPLGVYGGLGGLHARNPADAAAEHEANPLGVVL